MSKNKFKNKNLRNAYIVAKQIETLCEMIESGKWSSNNELATHFADIKLKNQSVILWLEDAYNEQKGAEDER